MIHFSIDACLYSLPLFSCSNIWREEKKHSYFLRNLLFPTWWTYMYIFFNVPKR